MTKIIETRQVEAFQDAEEPIEIGQWAGTLLMAEEYHAGNLDLKTDEPVYSEESKIKRRARRKNRKRK